MEINHNAVSARLPAGIDRLLSLAQDLYSGALPEDGLPSACATLPALSPATLEALVREIEAASLQRPRLGWAIAAVTDQAAAKSRDPFLKALAAWNLARAANDWVRPHRVEAAVQRAQEGFHALGERGWVAACDWQRFALPWTRNDFNQAEKVLAEALEGMHAAGLEDLLPQCRLSLAYAQILTAQYPEAEENILASERAFENRGDRLNLARCWLHVSSSARRQGKFKEALPHLEHALETFNQLEALIDLGKTHFQLAYCRLEYRVDLSVAEGHFKQAIEVFETNDLPLWAAQCFNGLAQINKLTGEFSKARKFHQDARDILANYEIYGLRADNLTDIGLLEIYSENALSSLENFTQAETLYNLVGARQSAAIAKMYQGRASTRLARYQQAIHQLESAQDQFEALENPLRQAECKLYLGGAWIKLNRLDIAEPLIDRAIKTFREEGNVSFVITANLYIAEGYSRDRLWTEAIGFLQNALSLSEENGLKAQTALCHRLLGENLLSNNDTQNAWRHLSAAVEDFEAMGILNEKAMAQSACGRYYALTSQHDRARYTWELVLASNAGALPDIAWRARQGLAFVAEDTGDVQTALEEYDRMVEALARIRKDFWQPSLAGSFLRRTGPIFDRAVSLAVRTNANNLPLRFIEESKSQTLLARFSGHTPESGPKAPSQLDSLAVEIRWLQERLSVNAAPGLRRGSQRDLQSKLNQKMQTYAELLARDERQRMHASLADRFDSDVDESEFQDIYTRVLGENWIAVAYYISETHLFGVTLSPGQTSTWHREITTPVRMALHTLGSMQRGTSIQDEAVFKTLGDFLVPSDLADRLKPDTTLILAPHRTLHRLPWAALTPGRTSDPLVSICIPVVVPSLQILKLLLQRSNGVQPGLHKGLLLGISEFAGRRRVLPHVPGEIAAIRAHLDPQSKLLEDADATWANLRAIAGTAGLSRYSFWHIATHAIHDPITGRLSGLSLYEDELWLDRLWELAPLPSLVTFSACSGTRSFVHEGDEHLGLATTCLAAGAQHVIGSLWDVPDEASARLMSEFYKHLWDGNNPARAIVSAQRSAIHRGEPIGNWGGFSLVGAPE